MIEEMLITQQTFLFLGEIGLFILSILELIFFPIPPDAVLVPLSLLNPNLSFFYALIASIGSVIGACISFNLGKSGRKLSFVRNVLKKENVRKVEKYFKKHGYFAVGIAAFTPFPDNVLSIASGILRLNLTKFLFALFLGRASRFFLEALFIFFFGEKILEAIFQFEILIIIIAAALILGYIILRR